MPDLEELRGRIDEITLEMLRLLKSRTDIVEQIGQLKRSAGRGVADQGREEILLGNVRERCKEVGMDESLGARFLNFLLAESTGVQSTRRSTHMSIFLRAKEMERQGRRVIHMEVGEPDFGPPDIVGDSLAEAVRKGYRRYGSAMGAPYLREALSGYASSEFGADVPPENVMVTPGGRFAVFLAMSLLNPGDEIAVIEPAWPAYRECAQNAGVRVRSIRTSPEDGWEPSVEQVRRAIGQNTRMLVLNYPNNPTGKILEPRLQKGIVDAAAESGIYVLSDEIYWRYAYSDWISVLRSGYEKSVVVQSFSKSHAMTGFRVGYTMADPEILDRMARLQALAITSVAEPVQYAAMHALEADISPNSETIRSRLAALSGRAREMGLDFVEPQGAMYLFARTGDGVGLAENLLERGVAVAPGEAFGDYGDHIRISACQDKKTLMEGMDMIRGMRDQK